MSMPWLRQLVASISISILLHLFFVYPLNGTTYGCGNSHNVMAQYICYITAVKLQNTIIIQWLHNNILIYCIYWSTDQLVLWEIFSQDQLINTPPTTQQNQFHLVPASMQSTNLYDIHLMLYVQSWTPDDGRKDHPKHVEWYSINSKNCASSWFYYWNISRCMVPWTSKVFEVFYIRF